MRISLRPEVMPKFTNISLSFTMSAELPCRSAQPPVGCTMSANSISSYDERVHIP